MDNSLNNSALNNALKQQKPAAKSDAVSARPDLDAQGNATPRPAVAQAPPLSVVPVLVPAAIITNEQKITDINSLNNRDKNYSVPENVTESGQRNSGVTAGRGISAYQAAGAVSGDGRAENSFDGDVAIFSPQNTTPIDIEV